MAEPSAPTDGAVSSDRPTSDQTTVETKQPTDSADGTPEVAPVQASDQKGPSRAFQRQDSTMVEMGHGHAPLDVLSAAPLVTSSQPKASGSEPSRSPREPPGAPSAGRVPDLVRVHNSVPKTHSFSGFPSQSRANGTSSPLSGEASASSAASSALEARLRARRMPTSLARSSAPLPSGHRTSLDNRMMPTSLARISAASSVTIKESVRYVEEVPQACVRAAIVISFNALLMAVAEIIIEILIVVGWYPKLPFRLDFFFLTLLSALLGYQSLQGVRKGHFDTSKNALIVAAMVETALIAGDVLFMATQNEKYPAAVPTRLPFLILTALNLCLVIYLYIEMTRFHNRELALEERYRREAEEAGESTESADNKV